MWISRGHQIEQVQGLWILIREKERIPSNDNCDYTLVINYLLIIIPNHSDCTFGTIFFLYKRWHEGHETERMCVWGKDYARTLLQIHTRIFHSRTSFFFPNYYVYSDMLHHLIQLSYRLKAARVTCSEKCLLKRDITTKCNKVWAFASQLQIERNAMSRSRHIGHYQEREMSSCDILKISTSLDLEV